MSESVTVPNAAERLAKAGSKLRVPSIRKDIIARVKQIEDLLLPHAEHTECPMDGTQDCCDTLVTQLHLMRQYAAVVETYGAMCDRLHECVTRHDLGLGGEHVDDLVIEALDQITKLYRAEFTIDNGYCSHCGGHWTHRNPRKPFAVYEDGEHRPDCPGMLVFRRSPAGRAHLSESVLTPEPEQQQGLGGNREERTSRSKDV